MKKNYTAALCLLIAMAAPRCKEPYDAKIPPSQSNYLVVEGFINATGVTSITLSRSIPLTDTAKIKTEPGALVTIEGEDNSVYEVRQTSDGVYDSDSLALDKNQKYRLHIKTAAGGEYLSEFVPVKITPPIDNVVWKLENNGLRIYVDAHDPQNETRYYKWNYEETWEIHARYTNFIRYENGGISPRTPDEIEKLYYCWGFNKSVAILLGSSAQLANDVINEAPLTFIPSESEKTSVRYSILVKQYALDRKVYDIFRLMKSNTESLGSVFDPLPSEITGNIRNVGNASEKVIGYITAATVQEKRIFITGQEAHSKYSSTCTTFYVKNNPDTLKLYFDIIGYRPYVADPAGFGPALGYFSSVPECVDCTTRGSNIKPTFW